MASRLASLLALLVLTVGPAAAQAPPAGTGTIFMGSYSGHITAVDEATEKVSQIPLKTGAPFVVRLSPDRTRFYVQSANQEQFEIVDVRKRQSLDSFTLSDARKHVRAVAFEADPQHKTMMLIARTATRLIDRLGDRQSGVHPVRPRRAQGAAHHSLVRRFRTVVLQRDPALLARRQVPLRVRAPDPGLRRRRR